MASNLWGKLDVYPVDEGATKKAVEEKLEEIVIYRRIGSVRREAKTTASYELREGSSGGGVTKQTENIAVFNVDRDAYLEKWDKLIDRAVRTLKKKHREIIERSFLDFDAPNEFEIAQDLGIGTTAYSKRKTEAILWMALSLDLMVFQIPCAKCGENRDEKEMFEDQTCIYCVEPKEPGQ